jgi:hypothetical protein
MLRATGTSEAEIDAGGDVPVHWVVQAINLLVKAKIEEIHFVGSVDPLGMEK